ncbi:heparinase II/III family protein [Roseitranquillus sediminis]|uniref:heparinase II/III family protein n=1 Tax=Roseitranquillus sediminis TaxID=2809051 RepID=UPI001D0C69F6|nr:heparinase II/III family protein [Roseitranquillus sediminis]MBM9593674.1 heparinase II/III family protein [Roseitranquillus sediminis]
MIERNIARSRPQRWGDALHARTAGRVAAAAELVRPSEPRSIGSVARGRDLLAGHFLFAGYLVESPGVIPWDITPPGPAFAAELHGFGWLDDLAAVAEPEADALARDWTEAWLVRYGAGRGPGWSAPLTGRRVLRWLHHAELLLDPEYAGLRARLMRALGRQTLFLARRWQAAPPGLPRIEALSGLVHAALAMSGRAERVAPATAALDRECQAQIGSDGGIATRNPEELLEIFTLLTWSADTLVRTGRRPGAPLLAAIARIAPTLRSLRHADGGLARYHGGDRGAPGRLDLALFTSGVRHRPPEGDAAMGYARLRQGRTSVIADVAVPPIGAAASTAHASTLAFELTSGRRPLIVNCGSGESFGDRWRRAGRATASHSTLAVEGYSSSRFGGTGRKADLLVDAPRDVRLEREEGEQAEVLVASHDGYVGTHGLVHVRELELAWDGRRLRGEDTLVALDSGNRKLFDRMMRREGGVRFAARFHLHPDVDAELDLGGKAVSLALPSGEVWVFRLLEGTAHLSLENSVYLEKGRRQPRATRQIALFSSAREYATRLAWSLAKTQDTPLALRDLER